MIADPEELAAFASEGRDLLLALDNGLVQLEETAEGERLELVNTLFRSFHTLKGNAGFFEFAAMQGIAHAGEEVLSAIRDGELLADDEIIDLLLRVSDRLREELEQIASTGDETGKDPAALIVALHATLVGPEPGNPPVATPAPAPAAASAEAGASSPRAPSKSVAADSEPVKVDPALIARLVGLVGELVLARNQVVRAKELVRDPHILSGFQRLHQITGSLQAAVLRTRMEPVGDACRSLPRLVRDVSKACGKSARLRIEGESTELDRSLLRGIHDPLVHLVRNAVDHGIESPSVREAAGKSPLGEIVVKSYCEGGQVHIEISDDGGGIDADRVAAKVVAKGLRTAEDVAELSLGQKQHLVFLPGLSTADQVSNISGRGVGMDVVRSNVERLGGSVSVRSELGAGTTFQMKIPLTLAVTQGLVIRVGELSYVVPRAAIKQAIEIAGDDPRHCLSMLEGVPTYRLRDRLIAVACLRTLLQPEPASATTAPLQGTLLIVSAGSFDFGMLVDAVDATAEIVVKSLGPHLDDLPIYAGATVLGDGAIAVILDPAGVAAQAGFVDHASGTEPARAQAPRSVQATLEPTGPNDSAMSVVLVADGDVHAAVPLATIGHFAHVRAEQLRRTAVNTSVSFRGKILPLLRLRDLFGGGAEPPDGASADTDLSILVHNSDGENRFGFAVERVLDLRATEVRSVPSSAPAGIAGQVLVNDRAIDLIDLASLAEVAA